MILVAKSRPPLSILVELANVEVLTWTELQATEHERDEFHLLASEIALYQLCATDEWFELLIGEREFLALGCPLGHDRLPPIANSTTATDCCLLMDIVRLGESPECDPCRSHYQCPYICCPILYSRITPLSLWTNITARFWW